jgi:2-methylcitrate dehydratase PrpD
MAGLTRNLAQFVATLCAESLPAQAIETARRGFIDCLGVMVAGRDEAVVRILLAQANCGPRGEARVLFDRGFAPAVEAALVNATAAHALDYDDTGLDGHPSVALVPALLAEGERLGASGMELIAGYVAGYETWAELVSRDEDKHHGKGWHPTAVFGTLAAAAAAARLARLSVGQTASALGIAASMASGLVANFGSMVKPLQVGRAVQNGMLAAGLAAGGLIASADALEHRAGFLQAFSPKGRVSVDSEIAAGRDWHILRHGLNVKRYPVCYALHRSIDAALELAERHDLRPEQVAGVEVRIGPHQAGMARHSSPENALDAKFSAEFAMAAALTARRVGLAELSDSFVRSAAVRGLMPKVRVSISDQPDPDEPLFARHDEVTIRLADGTVLESGPVRYAKGHARHPLGLAELWAKFCDCVGDALAPARRDAFFGRLSRLETLGDTAALYASN